MLCVSHGRSEKLQVPRLVFSLKEKRDFGTRLFISWQVGCSEVRLVLHRLKTFAGAAQVCFFVVVCCFPGCFSLKNVDFEHLRVKIVNRAVSKARKFLGFGEFRIYFKSRRLGASHQAQFKRRFEDLYVRPDHP
eukprot:TRINITY_DN538_c0_g1_i1.p1 TRINITY_DN538_c0_g1~~TRINITY_DN538_c0_g1_i1.p1  ORF type:complete len:150 (+),score=37.29 TRINITY_DN538_c0_g1_i1:49-450(+)